MAQGSDPRRRTERGSQPSSGQRGPRRSSERSGDGDRRGGAPRRGGERGAGRQGERGDGRRGPRRDDTRRELTPEQRTEEQARYDGPPIPDEVTGRELDRSVQDQLRGLPDKLAARVGRHLAAAGLVIDEDPETAYQHTLAARARAARIAVVREACGEAAYAAGHFAEAISELRAAKRMNGSPEYLAIIADCERALGRPERALELAKSPAVDRLSPEQRVEVTIVEAGARHELGETDGALRTLENANLQSASREGWVVRLRYAYADLLLKAERPEEALEWFHRTAAIDGQQLTDAADRVAELEARLGG